MHPNDHISLFTPYGLPLQTSGEAKYGVPVCVCNKPALASLDTFKSPNYIYHFSLKKY